MKDNIVGKQLKESILNLFENQLNMNRNKFELDKDIDLVDYSIKELDELVSQNIIKVVKLSNLSFRLEQEFLDIFLEKKWKELTDVLFKEEDSEEILDEEYWDFTKGITTKEDIWHYFDNNYSKGVHFLLYELDDSKIESVEELVSSIESLEEIDNTQLKNIANSIDLCNTFFTFELKQAVLDKLEMIELNHLKERIALAELKYEIISTIKELAELYGVKIEEVEDNEVRE